MRPLVPFLPTTRCGGPSERRHFAEYLTGLYVAARKNVVGINTEFAESTDQSCLNRWITEVPWDVQQLNEARLQELQQDPSSRYSARGVIALDNVLISHQGQLIEDAATFGIMPGSVI